MNFPKIGMRNIKTSASVFICLLFFQLINRENAIYACIAAIIGMQNTLDDSFKKGMERVVGTIVGGIAGALVLYIVKTYEYERVLLFIIPLGIMILIEVCVLLKLRQSVVICCVVYLIILISKQNEGNYVLYTFNRVVDTTIGILITIIVNKYLNIPDILKLLFVRNKTLDKQEKNSDIIFEQAEDNDSVQITKEVQDIETDERN